MSYLEKEIIGRRILISGLISNLVSDTGGFYEPDLNVLHREFRVTVRPKEEFAVEGMSLEYLVEQSNAIPTKLNVELSDDSISREILEVSSSAHQYIFNELIVRHNKGKERILHIDGERINTICRQIESKNQKAYVDLLQTKVLARPVLLISNIGKLRHCKYFDGLLRKKRIQANKFENYDIFWGSNIEPSKLIIAEKHIDSLEEVFLLKENEPILISSYTKSDTIHSHMESEIVFDSDPKIVLGLTMGQDDKEKVFTDHMEDNILDAIQKRGDDLEGKFDKRFDSLDKKYSQLAQAFQDMSGQLGDILKETKKSAKSENDQANTLKAILDELKNQNQPTSE